jgi:hypothetical protein
MTSRTQSPSPDKLAGERRTLKVKSGVKAGRGLLPNRNEKLVGDTKPRAAIRVRSGLKAGRDILPNRNEKLVGAKGGKRTAPRK